MNAPVALQDILTTQTQRVQGFAERLLAPARYQEVRTQWSDRLVRLRARRRVRVGPSFSLLFESEETVLLQVYEVLRVEGWSPQRASEELATYSCLLPGRGTLCATALIDGGGREEGLALARSLSRTGGLSLCMEGHTIASVPSQAESEPGEPVHFLRWSFTPAAQRSFLLGAPSMTLRLNAHERSVAVEGSPVLLRELQGDLIGRALPRWLLTRELLSG